MSLNRPTPCIRKAGRSLLPAAALLLAAACAVHVQPPFTHLRPPHVRLVVPSPSANRVINGSFESLEAEDPTGWRVSGRRRKGAVVRVVEDPNAPEGRRVAELSLPHGEPPVYGIFFHQEIRVEPWTTYDLSVWVRGVDLVSASWTPHGYGTQCGFFFWLHGPRNDPLDRRFPSGAYPRRDGTTGWELRKMRFTTPPRDVFPAAEGEDQRFVLSIKVQLFGTGTVQVDDIRLAPSTASPPAPRRGPGTLALVRPRGEPFFGVGLHTLPLGLSIPDVAAEKVFNFLTGPGSYEEKYSNGLLSMSAPWMVNPSCRGPHTPGSEECFYCREFVDDKYRCRAYKSTYLQTSASFGAGFDEENFHPWIYGTLEEQIAQARRIKETAARLRPPGRPYYLLAIDMPGGVYYNTYGWDDLARYHASEAFDIVSTIRRGSNPPPGVAGGTMSEFPQTPTNGIRHSTRRIADNVTDSRGRQVKPVWMLVNGGNAKIITDPEDPRFDFSPHDEEELRARRPTLDQLRYQLYAAVLNGATGLLFYQDFGSDSQLTADGHYWNEVLIPAAAELVTLERETGFLTEAEYNRLGFHVEGDSEFVDLMVKRAGEEWILMAANASPETVEGFEFTLEGEAEFAKSVKRLDYLHHAEPDRRRWVATPIRATDPGRLSLRLPGYGVAIYRFRLQSPTSD